MATAIDDYLSALPNQQRAVLQRLRKQLHAAVPGAEETIKTRVPALRYKGKTVVGFGAGASHLALYVMFGGALRALRKDLEGFDVSSRVVRFSPESPLPVALIRKIVRFRLAEIDEQTARTRARGAGTE